MTPLREEISDLRRNVEKIPREISTVGNLLQLAIDAHSSLIISKISSLIDETKDFDAVSFKNLRNTLEQQRRHLSMLDQELGAVTEKLKSLSHEQQKISHVLEELLTVRKYISLLEVIRNQIYNRDGPVATSLRSWALNVISQKASEYL
ncbi:MAG: SMC family ATPase, partial [Thaumarchaeota archaeon]